MAMLIPAAFAAITSAVGSVGAAVGTAGTAIGGAIGAGASTLSLGSVFSTILSGGATALGALSAVQQGKAQSAAYNAEAADTMFKQQQTAIDGRERRDSMRRDFIQTVANNNVATAASGLDLSFGTPAIARDAAKQDSALALSSDLTNEAAERSRLSQRAKALRQMARDAKDAGRMKGLGLALDFGVDALKRG